jgi:hypothetical protein
MEIVYAGSLSTVKVTGSILCCPYRSASQDQGKDHIALLPHQYLMICTDHEFPRYATPFMFYLLHLLHDSYASFPVGIFLKRIYEKFNFFGVYCSAVPLEINQCFGRKCHLHFQGRRISQGRNQHETGGKQSVLNFVMLNLNELHSIISQKTEFSY